MPSLDQRLASLDKEEALLKQRKAALLRRKLSLVKENGLYFYHPWLKQDLFHRAGAKRFRLFRAGN